MKKLSSDKQRLIIALRKIDAKEEQVSDNLAIDLVGEDLLMSSDRFNEYWREYVDKMAIFKNITQRGKEKSIPRNLDYAAIGVLDKNDLYGEAYLVFCEAYSMIKWDKVNALPEQEQPPYIWSFLKKWMKLNLTKRMLEIKDGIKVPYRELFPSSYNKERGTDMENKKIHNITALFSKLDELVFNNVEEVATTKYETDFIGSKLDDVIDRVLDLNRSGDRFNKGIERQIIRSFFGLDAERKSYTELAEEFGVSKSTLENVKSRAMKKLKTPEVMEEISYYMKEYKINTNSNARDYKLDD